MFDRFIRLARAKKALREQRYEDALQLALDPLIAADRRAEQIRQAAAKEVLLRGRNHLAAGDVVAARAAAERVRGALGIGAAAELFAAVDTATARQVAGANDDKTRLAEARTALHAGDLGTAEAMLPLAAGSLASEWKHVAASIADRRQQAVAAAAAVAEPLAAGAFDAAIERLQQAELLDRTHPAVVAMRVRVAEAAGSRLLQSIREHIAAGDLAAAIARYRIVVQALPTLHTGKVTVAVEHELHTAIEAGLRGAADPDAILAVVRAVRSHSFAVSPPVGALVDAVLAAAGSAKGAAASADPVAVHQSLHDAAVAVAAGGIAAFAKARLADNLTQVQRLATIRQWIDQGELDKARAALSAFLVDQPLHDGARAELAMLDRSVEDLDRRLAEARAALKAGRLRQACAIALSLHGASRVAIEAQQLVADARSRMELVERGLDEVRVALHGRTAATQEGVRHSLLRLQALAKLQGDHEELERFTAAVAAEIEALAVIERASKALDRSALADVLAAFAELHALRARLLSPDRLLSRWCDLADRLARLGDVALGAGRLEELAQIAAAFDPLLDLRPEFTARVARWQGDAEARRAAAAALVAEARQKLGERDLAEAERLVEAARLQWSSDSDARRLYEDLRALRGQTDQLAAVAAMTRDRDFATAQQKLAAMVAGPSPLLRTRIYDMQQNLAKAQGLEGAFLLRVDEGGERLVLRGESITIGNVRQNRADLPVLANLAGRHASIRRSMSFHGGMQDTVVAEEGDVLVAGRKVKDKALAAGDRVQLGPALGFVYQRPSGRSLTVGLDLQSGFQVAGTDRILLMKDRGRDGRILLGAAADVHVRVPRATGEVEVYANATGQIRVVCAAGGTIDGVAFKGEHPLAACQWVEAAGIMFQLLPWRPAA